MSDYVRFTKDGLMGFTADPETKSYLSEPVEQAHVLRKLRQRCLIDPDVTLGDIFRIVEGYPLLEAFIAEYSWCWAIRQFHEQAKLPRDGENLKLHYLEIARYVDADEHEYEDALNFGGVGEPNEHGSTHYGLTFLAMNQIAHYPVKLAPTVEIRKKCEKVSEHPAIYSLLDIVDAIYDDISFHGGPEEAAAFGQNLIEMMDDIESGRAKTTPLEDVFPKDKVN